MARSDEDAPPEIHPTAVVHPKAELAPGTRVAPYAVIGEGARVGRGTEIGPHVVLEGLVEIGERCRIFPGAVIGTPPQDLKYVEGIRSGVRIGDANVIREHVTIHRSSLEEGWTEIGNGNFIMAGSHIAHDCKIGNGVIIINYAGLTGFVEVEDRAVISGLTGIHQFTRVGTLAYIGGCSKVVQDVPPYFIADGNPAQVRGVNVVGLRRANVPAEARQDLQRAFKILYRSGLNTTHALERIRAELPASEYTTRLAEFIAASRRGIC